MSWPLLKKLAMQPVGDTEDSNPGHELLLYVASSLTASLALAIVIPITSETDITAIREDAVVNVTGIWFLAGIISATMGLLIERKPDEYENSIYESQATSKPETEYDRI